MSAVLILFAGGADGWGVGLKRAGHRIVAVAESDPNRRAALRVHHPGALIYADVRYVTARRLKADLGYLPDVVVGSPPCTDISCANNGRAAGIDGERSGLYFEFVRIVGEVRPDWYAAENAAQLKTRGYDRVHAALESVGYTCWPQVVGAREAGYFHLRRRSWLAGVDARHAAGESLGSTGQPWEAVASVADASVSDAAGRSADGRRRSRAGDVGDLHANSFEFRQSGVYGPGPRRRAQEAGVGLYRREQQDVADADGGGRLVQSGRQASIGHGRATAAGADQAHASDAHDLRQHQRGRRLGDVGGRTGDGFSQIQRARIDRRRAARSDMPRWLADIEAAARLVGLGGRTRLAEHYRVAHGIRSGLARVCISAYGDAIVPDIAEAFGHVMPKLLAELTAV